MGIGEDLAECLGVDVEAFDPTTLVNILIGFNSFIPRLINPIDLADLLPNFSLENVTKLIIEPVAASIPVPFGTLKPPQAPELNIEVFDPDALIGFVTGLGKVALGIPSLFGLPSNAGDLLGPPLAVPQVPSFDALVGLIAVSIGLTPPAVNPEFASKFARCLAKIVASPLGIS